MNLEFIKSELINFFIVAIVFLLGVSIIFAFFCKKFKFNSKKVEFYGLLLNLNTSSLISMATLTINYLFLVWCTISFNGLNIIDVEVLPQKQSWKGTPVPTSGYVENVYFNNNLSNEEINNIIKSIQNPQDERLWRYFALFDTDNNELISIYIDDLFIEVDGGLVFYENSEYGIVESVYNVNREVSNGGYTIDQNDKLSSLISITPFEYVGPEPYTLYRCNGKLYYYNVDRWVEWSSGVNEIYLIDCPVIIEDDENLINISLPNGRYLLHFYDFSNRNIKLDFGMCKNLNYGKFLFNHATVFIELNSGLYGNEGLSSYITGSCFNYEYSVYLEVDDYKVSFFVSGEV